MSMTGFQDIETSTHVRRLKAKESMPPFHSEKKGQDHGRAGSMSMEQLPSQAMLARSVKKTYEYQIPHDH